MNEKTETKCTADLEARVLELERLVAEIKRKLVNSEPFRPLG
jgi:uncharacterized protein YceH (UPF0502 family)